MKLIKKAHKYLGRGVRIKFHGGRTIHARITGISYTPEETLLLFIDWEGFNDSANILLIKGIEKNE
jgi:hypothetical protein